MFSRFGQGNTKTSFVISILRFCERKTTFQERKILSRLITSFSHLKMIYELIFEFDGKINLTNNILVAFATRFFLFICRANYYYCSNRYLQ
jgi:hypothetical protein